MNLKINKFESIYFPLRIIIFYFIYINIWRFFFIIYNKVPETLSSISHALRIDFSMHCGVFLASFIPWVIYLVFGKEWIRKFIMYLNFTIFIVISLVEFASVLLYSEWGTTVDSRALSYLSHPNEAWASTRDFISFWPIIIGLTILIAGIKRLSAIFYGWKQVKDYYAQVSLFVFVAAAGSIIGLRGEKYCFYYP
ncbi:MAG: hypothetical protein IPO92_06380 [Saprospiraceae bacterium]|nr:hypothetical protein [Saprospiraceae bacterium]